jgi:chorismate mutase
VRGATVASGDQPEAILAATRELLEAMVAANPGLEAEDIASVFFTVTEDLRSAYPAFAARQLGWSAVPMLDAIEIPVPGGMPRCIRVLIHWNTSLPQKEIRHVYLGEAAQLRPDGAEGILGMNGKGGGVGEK